jgi:hypothetical protein
MAIVYVDRSDVHRDHLDELKAGLTALAAFVEEHQPQLGTYGVYLDEDALRMTVVAVHPDDASLERHLDLGAPEFRKLAPFLTLREIEVFGRLGERTTAMVQEKADMLGDAGTVTIHERFAGYHRS